jgi:hypothetical protein
MRALKSTETHTTCQMKCDSYDMDIIHECRFNSVTHPQVISLKYILLYQSTASSKVVVIRTIQKSYKLVQPD